MVDKDQYATRKRLERLAHLLDSSIRLPGTNFRFGIDGLIGLIPGFGDAFGGLMSSYILAEAARLGVPRSTLIRMGFNVLIEVLVGLIPIVGDIFDVAWKANNRNVRLLQEQTIDPRRATTKNLVFAIVLAVVLIALIIGAIALGIVLITWLVQALSS